MSVGFRVLMESGSEALPMAAALEELYECGAVQGLDARVWSVWVWTKSE